MISGALLLSPSAVAMEATALNAFNKGSPQTSKETQKMDSL